MLEDNRLTWAVAPINGNHTLNQIGNLLSKTEGGVTHNLDYTGTTHKHAPVSVTIPGNPAVPYTYDANGNLTNRSGLDFKYDAENHLIKISQGSAYVIRMGYDGDGKRAKRVDNNGTIHYAGPHYERNVGNGATTTETITKLYYAQIGPYRRLIAMRIGGILQFVHSDHLGSSTVFSDTSGNETGALRYQTFGQTRTQSGSIPTDKLYTGQTLDASSGLCFYGARYYDSAGTFVSPDTIAPQPGNPQSLNRYSYGYNNPVKYTDPTGHGPDDPQGEGDSPFYIFVGGWDTKASTNESDWSKMVKRLGLTEGTYTYFEWERGWTGNGTASIERPVADTAGELSAQIGNHKNVVLVGHSKGGALIMEYLTQIAQGRISPNQNVKYAFTIDSPLDDNALSRSEGFFRNAVAPRRRQGEPR